MGIKVGISQPTVIDTSLTPLSDTFQIKASDTTEQWYYANDGSYKPNRTSTPLVLSAYLESVDVDTHTKYQPDFFLVQWYRLLADGTYEEITNTSTPTADYIKTGSVGERLIVRKNVSPESGETIKCVATAIDPRDLSQYTIFDTILLTTNQDATIIYPTLSLSTPPSQKYNVFTATTSIFTFTVKAMKGNTDVSANTYFEWRYIDIKRQLQPQLIEQSLAYIEATQASGKGQGTDTIKLNAMFAENYQIMCLAKEKKSSAEAQAAAPYYPDKAITTLLWEVPKMDSKVYCEGGSGVNNIARQMTFKPIVNIKEKTLTEAEMQEHLRFRFLTRVNTSSVERHLGTGPSVTVNSEDFRRLSGNMPVYAEVEMLGAMEQVTMMDGGVEKYVYIDVNGVRKKVYSRS